MHVKQNDNNTDRIASAYYFSKNLHFIYYLNVFTYWILCHILDVFTLHFVEDE